MNGHSIIESGVTGAKKLRQNGLQPIDPAVGKAKARELAERAEIAIVGSVDENGYPNSKAMFKIELEGVKTVYFSTNTSSRRVAQFLSNPKASVYFHDPARFIGLLLVGQMEVLLDAESKERLWRDGWEAYYPLGVADPDYTVLRFTAFRGNLYQGLQNVSFEV